MIENGTVVQIEDSIVTLRAVDQEKCKSCSGSFCQVKEKLIKARNRSSLPIAEGDLVEIFLPTGKTIFAGFMILIFPLILFALFYMLSKTLPGFQTEGRQVLAGLVGLSSGFGISYLLFRLNRNPEMPEIKNIVTHMDFTENSGCSV